MLNEVFSMEQFQAMLEDVSLHRILPALGTLVAGTLIVKALLVLVKRSVAKTRLEQAAAGLLQSGLKVLLYVMLILVSLDQLGVDISGVVALASVASLALSLALQDGLANIIGGVTLLSTHPFKAGDYVEIAGQAGSVQTIDITYTRLTTIDNKTIFIPNSAVVSSQIINYSVSGTRRIDFPIRISYDTDPQTVKAALLKAAQAPTVLTEPVAPLAAIRSYQDSSVEYVLQVWTVSSNYWATTFAVNENIRAEFAKAGISFTVPRVRVQLEG